MTLLTRLWRSLAVKWLFTLLFTGLFGVGLVWFFANRATNSGFDQLKIDQAQAQFETTATNYYVAHGSWDGIQDIIEPKPGPSYGGHDGPPPPRFILSDAANTMIACVPPYHPGDTLSTDQIT